MANASNHAGEPDKGMFKQPAILIVLALWIPAACFYVLNWPGRDWMARLMAGSLLLAIPDAVFVMARLSRNEQ